MEEKKLEEKVEEKKEKAESLPERETEKVEEKFGGKKKNVRAWGKEERTKKEIVWTAKTKVGKLVKERKITDMNEIIDKYKILEPEIVDSLLELKSELLNIGQSKGKFGGGKRRVWRQTQRKTAEGNVPSFACMVIVGDEKGHVGVGYGKAKETLPAKEKALRKAKLEIFNVERGCGSFDCSCNEPHSIPFKVEGKCESVRLILIPAPEGTGLVIGDEGKKILRLAGIKDIYSKTFGQTRSTINYVKACVEALKKTRKK